MSNEARDWARRIAREAISELDENCHIEGTYYFRISRATLEEMIEDAVLKAVGELGEELADAVIAGKQKISGENC